MPLSRQDADRVYVLLQRRAQSGSDPYRGATRIGLGLEWRLEKRLVAVTYRHISVTRPDGTLLVPASAAVFATLDAACRVDGRINAGRPTTDLSQLDDEPVWASGVGYPRSVPGVPAITSVLALGHTAPLAAARGMALAVALDLVPGVLRLKLVTVRRIDAKLLRENFERHVVEARREGRLAHVRHARIALGQLDESIDTSFVFESGTELPDTYDEETCALLTLGSGGVPQLWDAGAAIDAAWEAAFDSASFSPS